MRIFRPGHLTNQDYGEMVRTLNLGSTWKGEHQNRKKNHERYWESVLISPITDEQGVITNFVIVSEDITERKAIQHELVNAKEQAEESDRLKTSFLKNDLFREQGVCVGGSRERGGERSLSRSEKLLTECGA